ncbi:uncharacterized protein LOC129265734 [Lytechinus pictus]|uniref:uncharacterized protein LOC129265734 n=1 Tax=Lytechinus pictus TaxID=7653 RepID=UPI0030BA26CD
MTQGEDQRHGATVGEFQRNLDLSHLTDTNNSLTRNGTSNIHSVEEMLLPSCLHRSTTNPPSHGGEDAKNLLQFVHHASCDIKAALDQGNYKQFPQQSTSSYPHNRGESLKKDHSPVRRFSSDDMMSRHNHHNHPSSLPLHHHRQQQQPLVRERDGIAGDELTPGRDDAHPGNSRDIFQKRHDLAFPFDDQDNEHSKSIDNEHIVLSRKDIDDCKLSGNTRDKGETFQNRPKSDNDTMDLFSYVDLLRENSHKQSNDDDHSESDNGNDCETMSIRANISEKKALSVDDIDKSNKINAVPLRKRRLPASFWQEPKGKSDNHKIITRPADHCLDGQPRSFVHHPGLSLFGQLKLPVPSPLSPGHLDFEFGLGRHFCGDKNPFVYPSTSAPSPFLNLNMSYRPHLPMGVHHGVDERHRHGLHVPCGNNLCMCHLQNLAAFSSNVCEPPSQNTSSGMFGRNPTIPPVSPMDNTPSSSLALSRWSAMQSIDTPPDLLGGYTMPRVLKPIPTKSLTSYPSRFHPIFT